MIKKFLEGAIFTTYDQSLSRLGQERCGSLYLVGWLKLRSAFGVLCNHITPMKLDGKFYWMGIRLVIFNLCNWAK